MGVHRKNMELKEAVDLRLRYHFNKGKGVWASRDDKSWGRN